MKKLFALAAVLGMVMAVAFATPAMAIPALQLGPGSTGDWWYNGGTQTWTTSTNPFSVNAYANVDGGNGDFAWDPAGAGTRYAYLVIATIPNVGNVDGFDVSVVNDGGALSLFASGYGTPPIQDPNSIAPHGIFDTYFEIYRFQFNGAVTTISDTQPGSTGTGDGYVEAFDVTINSLFAGVTGIHMDLFTVEGDGTFDPNSTVENRALVNSVAPYSHDAENVVPEPGTMLLLGLGLAGAGVVRRRRKN